MKLKINQIIVLLLLVTMIGTSCGVFKKNHGTKFCGCPNNK
jgi:hypothetical protein